MSRELNCACCYNFNVKNISVIISHIMSNITYYIISYYEPMFLPCVQDLTIEIAHSWCLKTFQEHIYYIEYWEHVESEMRAERGSYLSVTCSNTTCAPFNQALFLNTGIYNDVFSMRLVSTSASPYIIPVMSVILCIVFYIRLKP